MNYKIEIDMYNSTWYVWNKMKTIINKALTAFRKLCSVNNLGVNRVLFVGLYTVHIFTPVYAPVSGYEVDQFFEALYMMGGDLQGHSNTRLFEHHSLRNNPGSLRFMLDLHQSITGLDYSKYVTVVSIFRNMAKEIFAHSSHPQVYSAIVRGYGKLLIGYRLSIKSFGPVFGSSFKHNITYWQNKDEFPAGLLCNKIVELQEISIALALIDGYEITSRGEDTVVLEKHKSANEGINTIEVLYRKLHTLNSLYQKHNSDCKPISRLIQGIQINMISEFFEEYFMKADDVDSEKLEALFKNFEVQKIMRRRNSIFYLVDLWMKRFLSKTESDIYYHELLEGKNEHRCSPNTTIIKVEAPRSIYGLSGLLLALTENNVVTQTDVTRSLLCYRYLENNRSFWVDFLRIILEFDPVLFVSHGISNRHLQSLSFCLTKIRDNPIQEGFICLGPKTPKPVNLLVVQKIQDTQGISRLISDYLDGHSAIQFSHVGRSINSEIGESSCITAIEEKWEQRLQMYHHELQSLRQEAIRVVPNHVVGRLLEAGMNIQNAIYEVPNGQATGTSGVEHIQKRILAHVDQIYEQKCSNVREIFLYYRRLELLYFTSTMVMKRAGFYCTFDKLKIARWRKSAFSLVGKVLEDLPY